MISRYGGVVTITAPAWYKSTRTPLQVWQDRNFECFTDSFTNISSQRGKRSNVYINGRRSTIFEYDIVFDGLLPLPGKTTATMETDEVAIRCSYWSNPIRPEV